MYKSAVTLLLIVTFLAGCKNTEKPENIEKPKIAPQEQTQDILGTQWKNEIQLNNGAKWEANLETTEGVKEMQEVLNAQETTTIEDYHQLATHLNEIKNTVVKECTMNGASHDNLHIWLYPLIEKMNALVETNNLDEAASIKQSIEDNLDAYTTFFQ